jgi:hypothetical protein
MSVLARTEERSSRARHPGATSHRTTPQLVKTTPPAEEFAEVVGHAVRTVQPEIIAAGDSDGAEDDEQAADDGESRAASAFIGRAGDRR